MMPQAWRGNGDHADAGGRSPRVGFPFGVVAILLLATWGVSPAQDISDQTVRARVTAAIADVLLVQPRDVELTTLNFHESSHTYGQRPTYGCGCIVRSAGGNVLGRVRAEVDAESGYVYYVQWATQRRDEMLRMATEFVASHFPGWSENMVLSEHWGEDRIVSFTWHEKVGEVRTGTFVYAHYYANFPGRPYFYGGYVGTARSMDDVQITKEQAIDAARQFIREAGYEGELQSAELYLDDMHRPFPHWYLSFSVGRQGAERYTQANILVHAVTGEVLDGDENDEE